MRTLLLILCIIPLCLSKEVPQWYLKVKNPLEEGKTIKLLPGIFTKVTFTLTSEKGDEFDTENGILNFNFVLDDENLITYGGQYQMVATNNIEFSAYIGLKCGHSIKEKNHKLNFKLVSTKDDEGNSVTANLNFPDTQVEISDQKTSLELNTLADQISDQSYGFLKLKNETFNVDDIKIKLVPVSDVPVSDDFQFNDFVISSFSDNRGEISEENPNNNGILFNSKFGIKSSFDNLLTKKLTNLKVKIDFEQENLKQCFELVKSSFNIQVIKNKIAQIKDKVNQIKEAITYNFENISPVFDKETGLHFRTTIPIAPAVLTCEFRADTNFPEDDETIVNQLSVDAKYYKNVFNSTGKISIKVPGLSSDTEYFAKCVLSNTDFVNKVENVVFKIGNFLGSDVISKLLPSRDVNRTPQCARFSFKKITELAKFKLLALGYCKHVMMKGEHLLAKALGTVVCKSVDSLGDNLLDKVSTICVAPSPIYFANKLITGKTEETFNKRFDYFVENISSGSKILKILKLGDIQIEKIERFYDSDPIEKDRIYLEVISDLPSDFLKSLALKIKVTNSNPQPIQCYYNKVLGGFLSKFVKVGVDVGLGANVILEPGESETITFIGSSLEKNKIYSLYFNCYNLPKFSYRFESTGVFAAYSYLFTGDSNINVPAKVVPLTINCEDKIHKMNPHCIHTKIVEIADKLKTRIPQILSDIEERVDQFSRLSKEAQTQFLKDLNLTLATAVKAIKAGKEGIKSFVEKSIETAKYLSNKDCSIYASASSSKEGDSYKAGVYLECRNEKKYIVKQLIDVLKEHFSCTQIVDYIQEGLGDNIEDNLKYVLFLINEISKNPESLEKGASQVLFDTAKCLQDNFETYWEKTRIYLRNNLNYLDDSILAVKRDASNIIMQTLSNLVNVIHFDEIDGYIKEAHEKVKETGLMVHDQAVQMHKNIFNFVKRLNEFGEGFYDLGSNMALNVSINANLDFNDKTQDNVEFVSELKDKGILFILHNNYMMRDRKAYACQSLVFDSPLVSIEAAAKEDSDVVNTFIGITLYDKDGNEILVTDMEKEFRPQILYLKDKYNGLKSCVYYNEKDNRLSSEGVSIDEDYTYNGQKYIRCVSKHLTSFTASTIKIEGQSRSEIDTEDESSSGTKWWSVLLIVIGVIVLLVGLAILFIIIRRSTSGKVRDSDISKDNVATKV